MVSRDEARHTGYGIKYLSAIVPTLKPEEVSEIEDFAFEAARLLIDSRTQGSMRQSLFKIWAELGIDPKQALGEIMADREKIIEAAQKRGGRIGPIRGFVIPTLRSIGLYSERIDAHFRELFIANLGPELASATADPIPLPEDLEAWVEDDGLVV